MDQTLSLNLLEDALDSLEEGLRKYEAGSNGEHKQFKFCILIVFHFVELSFKHFIASMNPTFIYENTNTKKPNSKKKTISMMGAIDTYQHFRKSPAFKLDELSWLKESRDTIQHYTFNKIDAIYIQSILQQILGIMNLIYHAEGEDKKLLNALTPDTRKLYFNLVEHYEKNLVIALKKAREIAQKLIQANPHGFHSYDVLIDCFDCGNKTFVYINDENKFLCTYCKNNIAAIECPKCGDLFPIDIAYDHCCPVEPPDWFPYG